MSTISYPPAVVHGLVRIGQSLISSGRAVVSSLSAETLLSLLHLQLVDTTAMPTHLGLNLLSEVDHDLYVRVRAHIIRQHLYASSDVTHTSLDPRQILREADAARALQLSRLQVLGRVCEQARALVEELERRQKLNLEA